MCTLTSLFYLLSVGCESKDKHGFKNEFDKNVIIIRKKNEGCRGTINAEELHKYKEGSKSYFGRFDKWMGRVLKRKKT